MSLVRFPVSPPVTVVDPLRLLRVGGLILAGWLLGFPAAQAATFNTMLSDVDWEVEQSVFECKLSQPVTGFGEAAFIRRAGEPEAFYLQQKQILMRDGEATIGLDRTSWQQPGTLPRPLVKTKTLPEPVPVRVDTALVDALQAGLLKGLRVIVTQQSRDDLLNPTRVVVEPLKLRSALSRYQDCLKQLLPVSYADVSRTTVYFDSASDQLAMDERRKLDWIATYVREDPEIKRVLIDGHTDSIGPRPRNIEVSKSRSQYIAAYLERAGVDSDRIITRWHGERYPIASNATAQGRLKNRRVTIRLER